MKFKLKGVTLTYEDRPKGVGYHWIIQRGSQYNVPRIVKVWAHANNADGKLYTNEDGGASVNDEIYDGYMWAGPIPVPNPIRC